MHHQRDDQLRPPHHFVAHLRRRLLQHPVEINVTVTRCPCSVVITQRVLCYKAGLFRMKLLPDDHVQGLVLHHNRLDVLFAPHTLQGSQYRRHLGGVGGTWINTPTAGHPSPKKKIAPLPLSVSLDFSSCLLWWKPHLDESSVWR